MKQFEKVRDFTLTDSEKLAFHSEIANIPYDPNGHCQYINQLRLIALRTLPLRIVEAMVKQKTSLSPQPYLFIHNLPTDNEIYSVPKNKDKTNSFKSGVISENLLLAFSSLIGEPYSITFEGDEIVNNLIPSQETAKDFTGLGSEVELDFHIENAALKYLGGMDYSPLGLFLTGVKFDPKGPNTLVADGREALKMLSKKDREILKSPLFLIKVPHRWRSCLGEGASLTSPVPIIRDDSDYPDIAVAFYSDIVKPLGLEAKNALHNFYMAVKEVSHKIEVKPGTIAYIDNRFALHAREAFQPSFDKEGRALRWIQRVFIAPSLWSHRKLIRDKHRVFQPEKAV